MSLRNQHDAYRSYLLWTIVLTISPEAILAHKRDNGQVTRAGRSTITIVTTNGGVPSFRGSRPETCHVQRSAQRPLPDARDVTTLMYSLEGRKKKVSPGRTFATSFSANRPGRCHVGCPYATSVSPGIDHIIDWHRHMSLLRSLV